MDLGDGRSMLGGNKELTRNLRRRTIAVGVSICQAEQKFATVSRHLMWEAETSLGGAVF
jgi:hypothetical protein